MKKQELGPASSCHEALLKTGMDVLSSCTEERHRAVIYRRRVPRLEKDDSSLL
jgi:hypothetical protein